MQLLCLNPNLFKGYFVGSDECWFIFEEEKGCRRSFGNTKRDLNKFEDCQEMCLQDTDCFFFDFNSRANEGQR